MSARRAPSTRLAITVSCAASSALYSSSCMVTQRRGGMRLERARGREGKRGEAGRQDASPVRRLQGSAALSCTPMSCKCSSNTPESLHDAEFRIYHVHGSTGVISSRVAALLVSVQCVVLLWTCALLMKDAWCQECAKAKHGLQNRPSTVYKIGQARSAK
eukprot:364199-Chlamydomonas_euryale.AAC.2